MPTLALEVLAMFAEALRRVPGVLHVVPMAVGSARVQFGDRGRSVFVYGASSEMPHVLKFDVRQGRFLPGGDPRRGAPVTVLGPKLKREIFGEQNALGRFVRIVSRYSATSRLRCRSRLHIVGRESDTASRLALVGAQFTETEPA